MMMGKSKLSKWVLSGLLWVFGGTLYFYMEVMWKTLNSRSESISWTMLTLAMILCIPLERFGSELPWNCPLLLQASICTVAITATEFIAGCILNLWLGLGIWDYSNVPFNILGQVCLAFSGVWFALSIFAIILFDWIRYIVEGGERPHYTFI